MLSRRVERLLLYCSVRLVEGDLGGVDAAARRELPVDETRLRATGFSLSGSNVSSEGSSPSSDTPSASASSPPSSSTEEGEARERTGLEEGEERREGAMVGEGEGEGDGERAMGNMPSTWYGVYKDEASEEASVEGEGEEKSLW